MSSTSKIRISFDIRLHKLLIRYDRRIKMEVFLLFAIGVGQFHDITGRYQTPGVL